MSVLQVSVLFTLTHGETITLDPYLVPAPDDMDLQAAENSLLEQLTGGLDQALVQGGGSITSDSWTMNGARVAFMSGHIVACGVVVTSAGSAITPVAA